MGSIDLQQQATEFTTSARLQDVASGLGKIAKGEPIGEEEKRKLDWAGNLVGQIDWNSAHYGEHPELSVTAANLRPLFYGVCIQQGIMLSRGYSEGIYQTLKSGCIDSPKDRLNALQKIFQSMANTTLARLHSGQI